MPTSQIVARFLLASSVAFALPMGAYAAAETSQQQPPHPPHEQRAEKMFDNLGLDDTQRAQVKTIMKEHHEKVSQERAAMWKQIDAVLTPEQREKAADMRKEHSQKMRDRMKKDG